MDEYEPGLTERGYGSNEVDLPDFNSFTVMELTALEEYAKDRDMERACAAAGYRRPRDQADRMLRNPKFRDEIRMVHEIWRRNRLAKNAEAGFATHMRLMEKFEKDYDELPGRTEKGETTIKGQLAGTLGKMSDSYLRASGNYDSDDGGGSQVVINVDMGDAEVEVDRSGKKARVSRKKDD